MLRQKIVRLALVVSLIISIGISLGACGKSEEVKACEQLIADISSDVTLENCNAIAIARSAYDNLSEDDAKKVDISSLEAAEEKLLELEGSPIEACKELKDRMKDPTSFRIYGDVLFVKAIYNNDFYYITCLTCDAKNSYGAYAGKKSYEGMFMSDELLFSDEEDEEFLNISNVFSASDKSIELLAEAGFTGQVFSGKRIAELINCDFQN